jgi:hypothetical protein
MAARNNALTNTPAMAARIHCEILALGPPRPFRGVRPLVRASGVVKPWPADASTPHYRHPYLAIDGRDCSTMGENPAETTVINRARMESDGGWLET